MFCEYEENASGEREDKKVAKGENELKEKKNHSRDQTENTLKWE